MRTCADIVTPDPADEVETPSGKDQQDENFPVASVILARRFRSHVKHFYDFARAADDIADDPVLSQADKLQRLDLFEESLTDPAPARPVPKAQRLRASLAATGVSDRHPRDLLAAFRQDACKARYRTWEDLLGYCALSANPVGRYLLDLHGESPAGYPASDALCTVLQVLNHLQDCGEDRRALDRVYIPLQWLEAAGTSPGCLDCRKADRGLLRTIGQMLDRCDALLTEADALPRHLANRRLAINAATIIALARRLSRRLRGGDPLAQRIALGPGDFALSLLTGVARGGWRRRDPAAPGTGGR